MKKVALIFMSLLIAFNLILPPDVAHANLVSKPLTITAKKVAKDVVKDTAVEMANQIVSEYLVRELLEGVNTDKGYSAVCMDGKKDNIKDCAPDKRAQIKTDLSQDDKKKLESKVETVLERKTKTSSKWAKFLDFFIPLFLINGAIEFISSAIDGDILSFFDEVAQEALIDADLLKPLNSPGFETGGEKIYDFTPYVKNLTVSNVVDKPNVAIFLEFDVIQKFELKFKGDYGSYKTIPFSPSNQKAKLKVSGYGTSPHKEGTKNPPLYYATSEIWVLNTHYLYYRPFIYQGAAHVEGDVSVAEGMSWLINLSNSWANNSNNPNNVFNSLINYVNTKPNDMTANVPEITSPVVPGKTDYGKQTATEKIKDTDGKVKMKGMNSFTYKYGDTYIYPSDQSKTGWKNKTTGEDITVVEDDVAVEDKTKGTDPPTPPDENDLDKDKEKEELEKESENLGNLITTRFPFSLPWDFMALLKLLYAEPMTPKWEVTGTEDIPLDFTIDLKFLDSYAPWFRGFVLVGFIFSVIFMHSRFMGGSK